MLNPRADGLLASQEALLLPIMAPRLQADAHADGVIDLALWGTGKLGRLRFTPLAGPYAYAPNRLIATRGGVYVAQSQPVLLIRGARLQRFYPARRCAWWHAATPDEARPKWSSRGAARAMELSWGVVLTEQRGDDLLVAVGGTLAEAERALHLDAEAIMAEAEAYVRRCDLMPEADPMLRSMVIAGVHAALSSIRRDADGTFAGLAAGQGYSAPARTYFRDGYWTLQPLLKLAPDIVRDEIRLLAKGVQPDGEAPSGVILSGPAQSAAWGKFIQNPARYKEHHLRPTDWWSDHFDSPLFFILAIGDYVRATGDSAEAKLHWAAIRAIVERYFRLAGPDGLPLKPRQDRDWADNVFREGLVSYNLGLWVGALDAVAELGATLDAGLAEQASKAATAARAKIDGLLWVESRQGYADYKTPDGFVEDHLVIDSLTLLRYHAVPEAKARRLLASMQRTLETRHNTEQPYGNWGVMCAYPPFKRVRDIRAKTAFPFRYHNGSDWPYWDGVYAEELLKRGLGGARYPLLRWWEVSLEKGWLGAVEYFAPPFGRGSTLQGWSCMPAAVAIEYGAAALAETPRSEAAA